MIRILMASSFDAADEGVAGVLQSDPELVLAGLAHNGIEAMELMRRLRPDVLVTDALLPKLNGLEITQRIMSENPTPIVVLSDSRDSREIELAMHALRAGALAVTRPPAWPRSDVNNDAWAEFIETIKTMSRVKLVKRWPPEAAAVRLPPWAEPRTRYRIVAVAASTGGPAALQQVFSGLPADFPLPIAVVQHIAGGFVGGFTRWLDMASPFAVRLAAHGERLRPHTAYIAPEDYHLGVTAEATVALSRAAPVGGFRPSADFLLNSVARAFGKSAIAMILTGMGRDGLEGSRTVRAAGGRVLVQDERSSVVFGMPRATMEAGLADAVLPLSAIAPRLIELAAAPGETQR